MNICILLKIMREGSINSRIMTKEKNSAIIQIENLRKVYRISSEKIYALNKIDLSVNRGEICCLLGTSGSGKSTLLNLMAGLEKPTRGTINIKGARIDLMSEKQLAQFRQKNFGFVFQSYNLLSALTALENVTMPLVFCGLDVKKRQKEAKKMLEQVGLKNRMNHRPTQMSGGQQQRVAIARAFVMHPPVIFADEPTGNLDSRTTIEVMEMMVNLVHKNRSTLVVVTHDLEIASYCDRIIHLRDGLIVNEELKHAIPAAYEKANSMIIAGN